MSDKRMEREMLRGLATITFQADDLADARKWYAEVLGTDAYFERRVALPGEDEERLAYIEFRIGDYQQELGIVDRAFVPNGQVQGPAGAIAYWHVDDVNASFERLISLGATEHQPPIMRGEGFVTASVVDPFGNILGVMYNRHYLDVLASS